MKISKKGLEKLCMYEGFMSMPYRDAAGLLTIGYGHLLTKDEIYSGKISVGEKNFKWKDGISNKVAKQILDSDADIAENAVNEFVHRELAQDQFDSLVSFVFNVGVYAFKKSTLLKKLNSESSSKEIQKQLMRWVYAGGRKLQGLINRRKTEAEAFNDN